MSADLVKRLRSVAATWVMGVEVSPALLREAANALAEAEAKGIANSDTLDDVGIADAIAAAEARGAERMREQCAQIVEAQPFYPDTHTGMRQQWVKDQAAAAIRALPAARANLDAEGGAR